MAFEAGGPGAGSVLGSVHGKRRSSFLWTVFVYKHVVPVCQQQKHDSRSLILNRIFWLIWS